MAGTIYMDITEFVEVNGTAMAKRADNFGGHYDYDDLPEGELVVASSGTIDQVGSFRAGNGSRRVTSRDALLRESENGYW